jgi:hypothetical protein
MLRWNANASHFQIAARVRKILPENNVLAGHSICRFFARGGEIAARQNGGGAAGSRLRLPGKRPNKVPQTP